MTGSDTALGNWRETGSDAGLPDELANTQSSARKPDRAPRGARSLGLSNDRHASRACLPKRSLRSNGHICRPIFALNGGRAALACSLHCFEARWRAVQVERANEGETAAWETAACAASGRSF